MNNKINIYSQFVETLTSETSKNLDKFVERLYELARENSKINLPLLNTSSDGLSSESGEFKEIMKKVLYQGKPLNNDTIFHIKRELGDIIFYWIQACLALDFDPYEIIEENIRKLESRYPGGKFDVWRSENRKEGDL